VNAEVEHQKCVKATIKYFQERGIRCFDFEEMIGHQAVKRPDLLLPDFHTLLEVKVLVPQDSELQGERRLGKELLSGEAVGYSPIDFFNRFSDHLENSRRKFREYPDHHTAVIFFDLRAFFYKQSPETLILGQEFWKIAVPEDKRGQVYQVGAGHNMRQLRRDLNTEIGAVAFYTGGNSFKIFHHRFAGRIRHIDQNVFSLPEDQHFEYIDDSGKPDINPLDGQ